MTYAYGMKGAPGVGGGAPGLPRTPEIRGELLFDIPGTYQWTVPDGVTTICAVVRSAAGGAFFNSFGGTFYVSSGAGCGLAWANNIPVTPGEQIAIVVGAGGMAITQATGSPVAAGAGGESYIKDASICRASGGAGGQQSVAAAAGARTAGDGGGTGGTGAFTSNTSNSAYASGGAAAGYSGNGGNGVSNTVSSVSGGNNGTGGAGGSAVPGGPSGGVGLFGEGASGVGGTTAADPSSAAGTGKGGSLGRDGAVTPGRRAGMNYDGAGGSIYFQTLTDMANGSDGAVRIVWGPGRSFPSTDVAQG